MKIVMHALRTSDRNESGLLVFDALASRKIWKRKLLKEQPLLSCNETEHTCAASAAFWAIVLQMTEDSFSSQPALKSSLSPFPLESKRGQLAV